MKTVDALARELDALSAQVAEALDAGSMDGYSRAFRARNLLLRALASLRGTEPRVRGLLEQAAESDRRFLERCAMLLDQTRGRVQELGRRRNGASRLAKGYGQAAGRGKYVSHAS